VNDHELAWDFKKSVKATHNDHVHVQEQGGTAQSVKILREGGEFGPTTLRNVRGQIKGRNGQTLNLGSYACGVVGQTNHIELACQMSSDHCVQTVHIFGAVLGAPFHADDVTLMSLRSHGLSLIALFDRLLFDLGAFDLAARGEALIAQHPQCFDLWALTTAAAVLQDLKITGSSHAVF
jgi:hypothetical protein